MTRCCDWCGSYCVCELCDDPKARAVTRDDPDYHGVYNPMEAPGHIHVCSDEHQLFWRMPTSPRRSKAWSRRKSWPCCRRSPACDNRIALAAMTDSPEDCDCVVDPSIYGSTVLACALHPEGGSPNSYAAWAAKFAQTRDRLVSMWLSTTKGTTT